MCRRFGKLFEKFITAEAGVGWQHSSHPTKQFTWNTRKFTWIFLVKNDARFHVTYQHITSACCMTSSMWQTHQFCSSVESIGSIGSDRRSRLNSFGSSDGDVPSCRCEFTTARRSRGDNSENRYINQSRVTKKSTTPNTSTPNPHRLRSRENLPANDEGMITWHNWC